MCCFVVHYCLADKDFAYDGEKSLFTIRFLAWNELHFTVVLDDVSAERWIYWVLLNDFIFIMVSLVFALFFSPFFSPSFWYKSNGKCCPHSYGSPSENNWKKMCRQYQSKTFKVEISFGEKYCMQAITNALRGQESDNSQEALRVLDIILR